MSRTYLQHPELFPEMKTSDPYYKDHLRDSTFHFDSKPRCAVCGDTRHSTSLHILSVEIDKTTKETMSDPIETLLDLRFGDKEL
jgi:uncharacterized protein YfeS